MPHLPTEIIKVVLDNFQSMPREEGTAILESLRLVNCDFDDFVTPLLFREFRLIPEQASVKRSEKIRSKFGLSVTRVHILFLQPLSVDAHDSGDVPHKRQHHTCPLHYLDMLWPLHYSLKVLLNADSVIADDIFRLHISSLDEDFVDDYVSRFHQKPPCSSSPIHY